MSELRCALSQKSALDFGHLKKEKVNDLNNFYIDSS